jgi:hypothetical protein
MQSGALAQQRVRQLKGLSMPSPKDFLARWGKKEPFVRFHANSLESLGLAEEDRTFLAQVGLAEEAAPFLSFEAPRSGELPTVADHWDQPDEFRRYRVIGADGSGNPIALDEERKGEVVCLDHEDGFARTFINQTIRQLAESLLAYRNGAHASGAAEEEGESGNGEIPEKVRKRLYQELKKIDSAALKPGCFWADELNIADGKEDYPAKVLRDLGVPEASRRLAASRHLQSELRKGTSKQRQEQFGNRQATTPLIAALDDPNPEVVRNATIALAMIARCYFQDDRAYPRILPLMHARDPLTQGWAVCAAIHLRGEDSLDDVLPLCKDRSETLRDRAFSDLFGWLLERRRAGLNPIRPESRERLQKAALVGLDDAKPGVRGSAAWLLCESGDGAVVAAVQGRFKKERNRDAKQSMKQALEMAEERL